MTDKTIWRQAVVSQRYTGPERRAQPRETLGDAVRAFLVLLLVCAALYSMALVVASYVQ
jgi:hypothetical protein